jgi:quinol monooxygenase YgiN
MIVITAKFQVKPEHAEQWPSISGAFTEATRAESGCLWFDWSRSLDDPNEYVLIEAFRDGDAGGAHVQSDHFKAAQQELPQYLAATPRIINTTVPGEEWSELGELKVSG